MPTKKEIETVIKILSKEYKTFTVPIVTEISELERNPFKVLISTLLSLRTKDETTSKATYRLFDVADTPQKMVKLSVKMIEKLIYPVGFYKVKALRIKDVCRLLLDKYKGEVPDDLDELLKIKGIGRKTANLVIGLGFGKPAICVDVHVHVIMNRLDWVNTKNPDQTEFALRSFLPKKYWIVLNDYLVAYGQNVCTTSYPKCGRCVLEKYCKYENKNMKRK